MFCFAIDTELELKNVFKELKVSKDEIAEEGIVFSSSKNINPQIKLFGVQKFDLEFCRTVDVWITQSSKCSS